MRKHQQLKCRTCGMYIPTSEVPVLYVRGRQTTINHRACVPPLVVEQRAIAKRTLESACRMFGVSEGAVRSKNRTMRVSEARHCACYAMDAAKVSTVEISRMLGRDISTVRHSVRMHHKLAEVCAEYREKAGRVSI